MEIVKPGRAELWEAWPREDADFTPWLAENLDVLDDLALGDLECLKTEVAVPGSSRRLDILATTRDDQRVAIENQYRSIDHDHFTRGLAYSVGLNAKALVIIAEDHQAEFVAVADYMNRCAEALGSDGIAVFLVTVQVETVGQYFVPRFAVRSEPNAWRSDILTGSTERSISEATDTKTQAQRQFWEALLEVATNQGIEPWQNCQPRNSGYISVSAMRGVSVAWAITVRANDAHVMLWLDFGDAAINLAVLRELRERADVSGLGFPVEWDAKEHARACSIRAEPVVGCGLNSDPGARTALYLELLDRTRKLQGVLEPHLEVAVQAHV